MRLSVLGASILLAVGAVRAQDDSPSFTFEPKFSSEIYPGNVTSLFVKITASMTDLPLSWDLKRFNPDLLEDKSVVESVSDVDSQTPISETDMVMIEKSAQSTRLAINLEFLINVYGVDPQVYYLEGNLPSSIKSNDGPEEIRGGRFGVFGAEETENTQSIFNKLFDLMDTRNVLTDQPSDTKGLPSALTAPQPTTDSQADDTATDQSNNSKSNDDNDEGGGGGLHAGAIAGIVLGIISFILAIILVVVLKRRRSQRAVVTKGRHVADASTLLATTYPTSAAAIRSTESMGEKGAVAESPHSQMMYTDRENVHSSRRGVGIAGPTADVVGASVGSPAYGGTVATTVAAGGAGEPGAAVSGGHGAQTEQTAGKSPAGGDVSSGSGLTSTVARHLVDQDMTEEEIRQLEEEERELDRCIEESGKRQ